MTRTRLYWICQLAGWAAVFGGFFGVAWLTGGVRGGVSAGWSAFLFLQTYLVSVAATHAMRTVAVRRSWLGLRLVALAPRMAGAALVAAVGSAAVEALVSLATEPFYHGSTDLPAPTVAGTVGGTLIMAALYLAWATVYVLAVTGFRLRDAERDQLQLRAALAEARMATLESQLNPHFLFNALNTVRALISDDPAEARRAVTLLSALLRQTLATARAATHALADELELAETYLALERLRFGDRLAVRVEAEPEALGVAVPALLVQTLAENAVKHGVARRRGGGEVAVTATVRGDRLSVRVTNPAPASASGPAEGTGLAEGTGTGLANARERLALLHGDRARLTLRVDADHAVAHLDLPATPADHA